jgi:N-methylhydantoinase A
MPTPTQPTIVLLGALDTKGPESAGELSDRENRWNPGVKLDKIAERAIMDSKIDPNGRLETVSVKEMRQVWFGGWVDTPVYWRDHLPHDLRLSGPAIIEQMDTTIIIEPGCTVTSDADGNLIVEVPHA